MATKETSTTEKKAVYVIIERGEGQKPYWNRVGVAFVNRDGSLNVLLDFPVGATKLHVRDFPPREEQAESQPLV